jgi:hypothetical protein
MTQIRGRLKLLLGLLVLLVLPLATGCNSPDSGADAPQQPGATAANEHLQRVTLRITGMV